MVSNLQEQYGKFYVIHCTHQTLHSFSPRLLLFPKFEPLDWWFIAKYSISNRPHKLRLKSLLTSIHLASSKRALKKVQRKLAQKNFLISQYYRLLYRFLKHKNLKLNRRIIRFTVNTFEGSVYVLYLLWVQPINQTDAQNTIQFVFIREYVRFYSYSCHSFLLYYKL